MRHVSPTRIQTFTGAHVLVCLWVHVECVYIKLCASRVTKEECITNIDFLRQTQSTFRVYLWVAYPLHIYVTVRRSKTKGRSHTLFGWNTGFFCRNIGLFCGFSTTCDNRVLLAQLFRRMAFLRKHSALLRKHRALLRKHRALLRNYMAFRENKALSVRYRCPRGRCRADWLWREGAVRAGLPRDGSLRYPWCRFQTRLVCVCVHVS